MNRARTEDFERAFDRVTRNDPEAAKLKGKFLSELKDRKGVAVFEHDVEQWLRLQADSPSSSAGSGRYSERGKNGRFERKEGAGGILHIDLVDVETGRTTGRTIFRLSDRNRLAISVLSARAEGDEEAATP